jgi:hypothetical protein
VDGKTQLPTEPGAINGGMMQRDERTPSPVITVDVEAIDDALQEIEAGGGTTITPRNRDPRYGAHSPISRTRRATCSACGRPLPEAVRIAGRSYGWSRERSSPGNFQELITTRPVTSWDEPVDLPGRRR